MSVAVTSDNPFFETWTTPHGAPPFDRIATSHFAPAFERGLTEHRAEVEAIKAQHAPASFDNTILAMERAGLLLDRVASVFYNLVGTEGDEALQSVERDMAPKLAAHSSAIYMDPVLFARVDAVFSARNDLGDEDMRLVERVHSAFVRAGARLGPTERARLAHIAEQLAGLGTSFAQNVLKDEASYLLLLEESDLDGLPESVRSAAGRLAEQRGHAGKYGFSLSRSSVEPFLTYSDRRDLRETLFNAWTRRGESGGETDNRGIIAQTVRLRAERAKLLGYETYADFKLADTMAEKPAHVRDLLDRVWPAGRARAQIERDRLQALVEREGQNFELAAHDWRHYAEKLRRAEYDFDETQLRPYFPLDGVIAAAFDTASKLFGLAFEERHDLPVYNREVRTFEVKDAQGRHIALFYGDYFGRETKRSGAWMSHFRHQQKLDGEKRPIIVNVMNLVKPGEGQPALLGLDEARTLFHEFGHALHGMLSDVTYPWLSGTSVASDFVELPSQLYEHWLLRPEVLGRFAKHVETGEPIPQALVDKVQAAATFNQGFATVEYTSSAIVDLDVHMMGDSANLDVAAFEKNELASIGMPREIVMRHRPPHFAHIFSGEGYAAGYYSYLWSEVLDADAFEAFTETGDVFNPDVARRLKEFVYAAGNKRPPAEAYKAFRGRLPSVEPLLKKRGLVG